MSKHTRLKWIKQDPALVPGLVMQADTEMRNYWLQVYEIGSFFCSTIYGISTSGRFERMGNEYCNSIESAKAIAEAQWESFRKNSSLYKRGAK